MAQNEWSVTRYARKSCTERAIEKADHVGAMYGLGILLQNGAEGVERNAVRSKELDETAIEKANHVGAMYNLGVLLKNSAEGVERNAVRAVVQDRCLGLLMYRASLPYKGRLVVRRPAATAVS